MIEILRHRDLAFIYAGSSVSQLGNQIFAVALPLWVLERTGSGAAMGLIVAAGSLPILVLAPFAGVLVDRRDRRWMLVLGNAAAAAATAGMLAVPDGGGTALLYPLVMCLSAASLVTQPALRSLLPDLAPPDQLLRVNALVEMTGSVGLLAGPLLAGALLALGQPGLAIAANALSFVIAAALAFPVRAGRMPVAAKTGSVVRAIAEGGRVVWRRPALRVALGVESAYWFFFAADVPLLYLFLVREHAAGPEVLGLAISAIGAGWLATSVFVSARIGPGTATRALGTGIALVFVSATAVVSAGALGPIAVVIAASAFGVQNMLIAVGANTIYQAEAPRELRGRVVGLRRSAIGAASIAGLAVAMPLADVVGASTVLVCGGVFASAAGLTVALAARSRAEPRLTPNAA